MLWIEALFQVGCSVGTLTNSMYGKVHHRLHACLLTMVNGTGGVVIWSVLWYSFGQCATNASPRVAHTSRLTSADTQPPPLSTNQQNLLVPIPHVPPLKLTLNIGQTWDSEFYKVLINFCQELGIFFRTKKRGSRPLKQNIVQKKDLWIERVKDLWQTCWVLQCLQLPRVPACVGGPLSATNSFLVTFLLIFGGVNYFRTFLPRVPACLNVPTVRHQETPSDNFLNWS